MMDDLCLLTVPQMRALLQGMRGSTAGAEEQLRGRLRMRLDRQARLQVRRRPDTAGRSRTQPGHSRDTAGTQPAAPCPPLGPLAAACLGL